MMAGRPLRDTRTPVKDSDNYHIAQCQRRHLFHELNSEVKFRLMEAIYRPELCRYRLHDEPPQRAHTTYTYALHTYVPPNINAHR
jgi:hypothetical protein